VTIHLQTDAEMDRLLSRIGDSRTVGVLCVGHVNKSDGSQAFVELWSTAMSAPDRLTITFKP
jgi:hypothetical protein